MKRLFEYDFCPESELLQNPLKMHYFSTAVQMYDMSLSVVYSLNKIVRERQVGGREEDIVIANLPNVL